MFDIPFGIDVRISWDSKRMAYSNEWARSITVGPSFLPLPEQQQSAIIMHEAAHILGSHGSTRLKWLLTGKWRNLLANARKHEFEADRFCASMGYADAMIQYLKQHPEDCSVLHPSTADRITQLEAAK